MAMYLVYYAVPAIQEMEAATSWKKVVDCGQDLGGSMPQTQF